MTFFICRRPEALWHVLMLASASHSDKNSCQHVEKEQNNGVPGMLIIGIAPINKSAIA
jgi:hypothetical protein